VGLVTAEAFFQFPKVKITIKNYGQTPAFLRWWSLCFTCESLPETPVYEGPAIGMVLDKIVIDPGGTLTLSDLPYWHRQEFAMEDVGAIVKREKQFHAYGYVCYGDIFGNPIRRLKFCQTVLNVYGGELICDWWEGLAPPEYTGTDQIPFQENAQQQPQTEKPN
jgi:hypothetical protein